jgi:hypothetical protein
MPRYEWRGAGVFRDNRNGRDIEPGDVVKLDAHVAERQPEFARVDDTSASDSEDSSVDAPLDPTDFNVTNLDETLGEADFSASELDAIEARERADGSPRSTALDAIESARE